MDTLSDMLAQLRPQSAYTAGLDAAGDWNVHFGGFEGIKFNAVTAGTCWVLIDGNDRAIPVAAGECFLMTRGKPFSFATDLALPAQQSDALYAAATNSVAVLNGGGDFFLVGGRFDFGADYARILFESLPEFIHIRPSGDETSVLHWGLKRLAGEVISQAPGAAIVAEHLSHIMLVEVLRQHLAATPADNGWFAALADRQLSRALAGMHRDLARRWTLDDLAELSGMSRSIFAKRFRDTLGVAPLAYLTRWRMQVAGDKLRKSSESVAEIAASVGYESESAFNAAFKRTMIDTPRSFQRAHATTKLIGV